MMTQDQWHPFAATCWIPLSINPFINLRDIFVEGLKATSLRASERTQMTDDQKYKCIIFQKIMKLVPNFLMLISDFRTDMITYDKFIKEASWCRMSMTRSNIMSALKQQVNHIPPAENCRPTYVLPDIRSKNKWGWNHPVTVHLLCPMHLVAEFEQDPASFQAGVQEGQYQVTAADYPAFLYDESKYDPVNPVSSLFKGHVLLCGYRHIFTGPASWENGEAEGGKQSRGIVNKLKAPTPQMIAYAAVMIQWALSSTQNWEQKSIHFDYNDFFQAILITMNTDIEADMGMDGIDDETARWLAETLCCNVPVLHQNNTANITPEDFEDKHSDLPKLKAAQRGKLTGNGVDFPLDPQLIQQVPPPAPEEPQDDQPDPRLQPCPITHRTVMPSLPEEPRDDQPDPRPQPCPITHRAVMPSLPEEPWDDHPEPRPQPHPIMCRAIMPTLPKELHDDQPEPHRHSLHPIMPMLPEEPQDGGQSNKRALLPSPLSKLPHQNLEASIQ
ncbi:hypothetical protein AX14_011084 [Amanita brunnescens Koide BX004]|nr:hypothetical protein AX14_011084 [Amanita brunnescens Koide BX004]